MDSKNIPSSIFCTFQTNLPEQYKIDEHPIELQSDSNHENLSEMLCHLLDLEPTRFEFLVNGEFLRGNLKSYYINKDILLSSK